MPVEETEGLEHEEQLGLDHPGSMAYKLAHADDAPQSEEDAEAARLDQEEADRVTAEAAETPEEREAREAATAALEPPKPKYASIEEAERAANEAASRMHTATEETARERKAREALEEELAGYKAKVDAATQAQVQVNPERKAAFTEALKKIQAIPLTQDAEGNTVYPPDYDDQVAEAWASTSLDPSVVAKEAARLAREELRQERVVDDNRTAAEKEEAERIQTRADAEKLAGTMGLDMTPGSADYRLFYSHVDELASNPEHEFRNKSFEEQVAWATGGVRQILGKKIELTDAERAAARRTQTRNAVLERGVTRVAPAEQPRQRSMQEILGQ